MSKKERPTTFSVFAIARERAREIMLKGEAKGISYSQEDHAKILRAEMEKVRRQQWMGEQNE